MSKSRLEAFSDAVIAIIMTIMVLEMKIPHGNSLENLRPLLPTFLSYTLSYAFLGIYWNNHHHMLQIMEKVNGRILWANLHLLFWLSLIPFATDWMGKNHTSPGPVAFYGIILLFAAIAYFILQNAIISHHGEDSKLKRAIGKDLKSKLSLALYTSALLFSYSLQWVSIALYVTVALMWLIPDRRIEKNISIENPSKKLR